jgi:hypothetical protein
MPFVGMATAVPMVVVTAAVVAGAQSSVGLFETKYMSVKFRKSEKKFKG